MPLVRRVLIILLLGILGISFSAVADDSDSNLYYAAERSFDLKTSVELRLGAGYDFSNPYLNILSFQGGVYYLLGSNLAFGAEGTLYSSSQRGSTQTLQQNLGKAGVALETIAPQYKATAVVRLTPITGLVNLLSTKVIKADIHLLARGGVVQYETVSLGPVVGGGLETQVGLTPRFGVFTSISWDFEKPGDNPWQGRTGFLLGPTFRF